MVRRAHVLDGACSPGAGRGAHPEEPLHPARARAAPVRGRHGAPGHAAGAQGPHRRLALRSDRIDPFVYAFLLDPPYTPGPCRPAEQRTQELPPPSSCPGCPPVQDGALHREHARSAHELQAGRRKCGSCDPPNASPRAFVAAWRPRAAACAASPQVAPPADRSGASSSSGGKRQQHQLQCGAWAEPEPPGLALRARAAAADVPAAPGAHRQRQPIGHASGHANSRASAAAGGRGAGAGAAARRPRPPSGAYAGRRPARCALCLC